jgi:hypothetical protein
LREDRVKDRVFGLLDGSSANSIASSAQDAAMSASNCADLASAFAFFASIRAVAGNANVG